MFVIAVAVGCAVGYAQNGRLRRLGDFRLQAPALVGLALVLQVGAGPAPGGWRRGLIAVSYLAVGAFLAVNRRGRTTVIRMGISLLALGWVLNVAAMAPHAAMPVSAAGLDRAGHAGADVTEGHLSKHVLASGHSPLAVLGDVIPVPALHAVLSVGDLGLLAGIALCTAGAMTTEPARPSRPVQRRDPGAIGALTTAGRQP